jgi:16S rRNA processing protein RimM
MTLRRSSEQAADEVLVGRIAGPFGIRGELKCDPTGAGRTVFSAGTLLRCVRAEAAGLIRIADVRPHKGRLLIRVEGVGDADAATAYSGGLLYAPRRQISLAANEYLDDDLAGCEVWNRDGVSYGIVERVEHYPSSDMLVVNGQMVPMVRAIVVEVDVERRRITIDPPVGLLD